MKELLTSFLEQLKRSNGPTRIVIGAAIALALLITSFASFRANNPNFVLLDVQPDAAQLAAVQAAIAGEGIRFKSSPPPAPHSLWVEEGRQYEARNAIALAGAMSVDPRGIFTGSGGASSVFLGASEREQQMLKRRWEETEKQLEVYNWIAQATVTSSTPSRSPLSSNTHPTVSVVLQLRGIDEPDREQRDTVATIVRSAFGVPKENVVISDQLGRRIYDGSSGEQDLFHILDFQRQSDRADTDRVQVFLDTVYGPGLAYASVHSDWAYRAVESVDEAVDPSTKVPVSTSAIDTSTPQGASSVGGIAGGPTSAGGAGPPDSGSGEDRVATTSETREEFLVGRRTTHTVQDTPVLERLTVTIRVDQSLSGELATIEEAAKKLVGFDEKRGDEVSVSTARFFGLERDAEGNPVTPDPEALPEPTNPTIELLLEHGIELLAAVAFLFVLLRSLKSGGKKTGESGAAATRGVSANTTEEVDLDLLARRQVEELVTSDPDKVGELLSRWALDQTHAGNRS